MSLDIIREPRASAKHLEDRKYINGLDLIQRINENVSKEHLEMMNIFRFPNFISRYVSLGRMNFRFVM